MNGKYVEREREREKRKGKGGKGGEIKGDIHDSYGGALILLSSQGIF